MKNRKTSIAAVLLAMTMAATPLSNISVAADEVTGTEPGGSTVTWQDGTYTGVGTVPDGDPDGKTTHDRNPSKGYSMNVTVDIKNGKIADLWYTDGLEYDGNISYRQWAMDGHYYYDTSNKAYIYKEGVANQVKGKSSSDDLEIDTVTGATKSVNAIKEGLTKALGKAAVGEKDESTKTPTTPDDTKDVMAPSGKYKVNASSKGLTIVDAEITSKDGQMKALITLSGKGYDYLYFGTEKEAMEAGEDAWYGITSYKEYVNSSGTTKTGAQFLIPVTSLDKDLKCVSHAKSSGNWFYRTIRFDSLSLKPSMETGKTYSMAAECVMDGSGEISGMYGMDNIVVTPQKDGSYLVRLHQGKTNRNILALTNDKNAATNHSVPWYAGAGSDGYYFTISVKSLMEPLYYCMSSEERIKDGKEFGNVVKCTFDIGSITESAEAPVTMISLNSKEMALHEGKENKLNATVVNAYGENKAVTWSSNNESVATVKNGVVTAKAGGSAVITASVGNYSAECKVTVTGHKEEVIPAVSATEGKTGLTEGKKCSICGTILVEQKETTALPILVKKIKITSNTSTKIAAGKKVQLKATVTPSNAANSKVQWKSSNTKYATVNAKGLVTLKKNAAGKTVTITATAKDGSKVAGTIKIACMKGAVKKITISGKKTVKAGKTLKLKAKVTAGKKANTKVTWSTSNKKLATVSAKGVVKTFKGKKGTVTITAKSLDGTNKKKTIKIKIK